MPAPKKAAFIPAQRGSGNLPWGRMWLPAAAGGAGAPRHIWAGIFEETLIICRLRDAKPLCVSPLCLQLKPSDSVSPGRQGTIGTGIQTPCTGIKALALSSPARDALAGSKGAGLGPERSSGSLVRSPREAGRRRETDPLGWRPLLGDHVGPDSSCVPTATRGTFRL